MASLLQAGVALAALLVFSADFQVDELEHVRKLKEVLLASSPFSNHSDLKFRIPFGNYKGTLGSIFSSFMFFRYLRSKIQQTKMAVTKI